MTALQKTNRLLQIFFSAFLLIAFRLWHLAVFQREEKLQEAERPQRRTIVQRADRGAIVDRFGLPLAVSTICYNAAFYYSQCMHIPAVQWKTTEGRRVKLFPRKAYIHQLSLLLGEILAMDPERIEDLIHAKASLIPHIPLVLQSHISEGQYYRIKALEREWVGLHAEMLSERFYPMGKTASHLLGHLGAISQKEYLAIAGELEELRQGNEDEELLHRYQELKEKAYSINDFLGKAGLEKQYEQELRGSYGKKTYEVDHKGRHVRELPGGKEPVAGKTISLSLSLELQQFCEELLIQNDETREGRSIGIDVQTKMRKSLKQPWIRGGAIVALDPNTGEVLALAGIPRFDPNDYLLTSNREAKLSHIRRWQESEQMIADLWDGKELLIREKKGGQEEKIPLTWETYLQWLLPADGPILAAMRRIDDLKTAIQLQEDFEELLYFADCKDPDILIESVSKKYSFLNSIPQNSDKLFVLDLCRMAVYSPAFTDELITKVGSVKLGVYRTLTQALRRIEEKAKNGARFLFHQTEFRSWKEAHQKEYLLQKRAQEKEQKVYAKPYIDYLDQKENELFDALWQELRIPLLTALLKQDASRLCQQWQLYFDPALTSLSDWNLLRSNSDILSHEECLQWLRTMRPYRELDRPLWSSLGEEKNLAAAFYPTERFGFMRSHALQSAAPLGSLFKLVVAYETLRQQGPAIANFSLFDEVRVDEKNHTLIVAATVDHKPLSRHYKGGRLPRSHLPQLGKVDLIGAIEQSSNPYFAVCAGDHLNDPTDLVRAAAQFGFGERSGIDLPSELKGKLPTDLATNRTGLYSFAIGQHTLVVSPLQSALMLSTLANGGKLLTPHLKKSSETAVRRTLPLPTSHRNLLFEGMDRVVWGSKGNARPSAIKGLMGHPPLLRDFLSLQHQMIGKTSTAEILCRLDRNPSARAQMYKHIWFGAIAFSPPSLKTQLIHWEHPELVVVVYLRYGDGGKEAAPLAAQVIHKWREIQKARVSDFDKKASK